MAENSYETLNFGVEKIFGREILSTENLCKAENIRRESFQSWDFAKLKVRRLKCLTWESSQSKIFVRTQKFGVEKMFDVKVLAAENLSLANYFRVKV